MGSAPASPDALERALGHRFARRELLEQALTHRSFGAQHNERLEFLGDGVLGCVMAAELYQRFPELTEGKLTRLRASLVREEALAEVGGELGVPGVLRLGEGELHSAAAPRPSIVADAVEALFGALYLDGGYEAARTAVAAAFASRLDHLNPQASAKDAKTRLQERLQAAQRPLPEYHVVEVRGAAHKQTFQVECRLESGESAFGNGTSRQRAEQEAARAVLERLGE